MSQASRAARRKLLEERPPKVLCGGPSCDLPWEDHLTKKGGVREKFDNEKHWDPRGSASLRRAQIRAMGGQARVGSSFRFRRAVGITIAAPKALPSLATHVAVFVPEEDREEAKARGYNIKGRRTLARVQAAPKLFKE